MGTGDRATAWKPPVETQFKAGDLSKQDCLPSASGPSSQSSEEKGLLGGRGGERKRERKEAEEGEER